MRERDTLRDHVVCVRCAATLDLRALPLRCSRCDLEYATVGSIPVVLPRADDHLTLWRQQLNLLKAQGQHTLGAIEEELETPGLSASGQTRLRALSVALREQLADITDLVEPALGGPPPSGEAVSLPRGVVEYIQFLYRDWGWESAGNHENQRALDTLREVMTERPLGRTLVLGAGACRLAYDLHRECGASETAVIDIDPFLLVIAEAVIRGRTVRLTESTANVQELAQVSKAWSLSAPAGALSAQQFHFFLANGVAPPFDDGTFDTVVTPWFIDQVSDLPALLTALGRVLAPGGRWLNSGPLLYSPDTALSRRYSREEVFELLEQTGFHLERWATGARTHLESPLNGRAKREWVLSFEASRSEALPGSRTE